MLTFRLCQDIKFNRPVLSEKGDEINLGSYTIVVKDENGLEHEVQFDLDAFVGTINEDDPCVLEAMQHDPDYVEFPDIAILTEQMLENVQRIDDWNIGIEHEPDDLLFIEEIKDICFVFPCDDCKEIHLSRELIDSIELRRPSPEEIERNQERQRVRESLLLDGEASSWEPLIKEDSVISWDANAQICGLAANPHIPLDLIQRLSVTPRGKIVYRYDILDSIARNPSAPLDVLLRISEGGTNRYSTSVAANPLTSTEVLRRIATISAYPEHRRATAENRSTTSEILALLAVDENPAVRKAVASNPNTSDETLRELLRDPFPVIANAAVDNPSLSADLLEKIAKNDDPTIRILAAASKQAPAWLLDALSNDEDVNILRFVAKNRNTDTATLERLYLNPDLTTKVVAARNLSSPKEFAEELAHDNSPFNRKYQETRFAIADSPRAPEWLLEELAVSDSDDARRIVAANPKTPQHILELLSKDSSRMVQCAVLDNPSAPPETLIALADSEDDEIRSCVANNPNAPADVLRKLTNDEASRVRSAVAKNACTPAELLLALARDKNPNVSSAAIERLPEDALNEFVPAFLSQLGL